MLGESANLACFFFSLLDRRILGKQEIEFPLPFLYPPTTGLCSTLTSALLPNISGDPLKRIPSKGLSRLYFPSVMLNGGCTRMIGLISTVPISTPARSIPCLKEKNQVFFPPSPPPSFPSFLPFLSFILFFFLFFSLIFYIDNTFA